MAGSPELMRRSRELDSHLSKLLVGRTKTNDPTFDFKIRPRIHKEEGLPWYNRGGQDH
jgi:hypothetical protein